MGTGVSIFLIAVGAILYWGVTGELAGVDVDAIGVILMIVGALGLVLTMLFWRDNAPYRRGRVVERDVVHPRDIV